MALIKCPECGKDISDQAPNCPNCGVPICEPKMDIQLVCPNCKSQHITTVSQAQGYNKVKGVTGMLLFGGIGLLAGAPNDAKVKISCMECGHMFDPGKAYKMPVSEKAKLELERIIKETYENVGERAALKKYQEITNDSSWTGNLEYVNMIIEKYNLTPEKEKKGNMGCLVVALIIISIPLMISLI